MLNKTVQWVIRCNQCDTQEIIDFDTRVTTIAKKLTEKGWLFLMSKEHYALCPKCFKGKEN
jgi:hypothetical protein